jgi:hypothetical protein
MTLTAAAPMMRLVVSGLVIFAVLAAVAGVSGALFTSAPAIATDNTFTTGSADLQIASDVSNAPGTYGSSIPGADVSGLLPGDEETFTFWLKNNSAGDLELDLAAALTNISAATGTDLESNLTVNITCDNSSANRDGGTGAQNITDWAAETSAVSLNDGHHALSGRLGASNATNGSGTDESKCTMTATLASASTAAAQTVSFDAEFTGTQPAVTE